MSDNQEQSNNSKNQILQNMSFLISNYETILESFDPSIVKCCKIKAKLLHILYSGLDLGEKWSFIITINEKTTNIDASTNTKELQCGTVTVFNQDLAEIIFENGCNKNHAIHFSVVLNENSFANTGIQTTTIQMACTNGSSNIVTIPIKIGTEEETAKFEFIIQLICSCI